MVQQEILSRTMQKSDIEGEWQKKTTFVPLRGEFIVYLPDKGKTWTDANGVKHTGVIDYARIKIGDGTTTINNLPFVPNNTGELIEQDGELLFMM
jgi:hypothetical protein